MHDAAPLALLHAGHEVAHHGHAGGEVDFDIAIPHLVFNRVNRLRVVDARVVDQDVHFAEALQGFVGQGFDLRAVTHVGAHPLDLRTQAFADLNGGGLQLIGVAAGDEHICASFGEHARDGFAEAFAAARDEGVFASEIKEGMHGG